MLLKACEKFWTPQNTAAYYKTGGGSTRTGVDTFWANVVLLMGFEGVNGSTGAPGWTDESSSAHGTATITGGADQPTIDTSQFVFGSSSANYPSGANLGRAVFADSADWDLGAGLFTIEFRFRPTTVTGANRFVVSQWNAAPNCAWSFFQTNATMNWMVSTTGSNVFTDLTSATLVINTWAAWGVDYDGTKYRMYKDGVMVASSTTARTIFNSTLGLGIGNSSVITTAAQVLGNIEEMRITKGVARYASDSGYTPAIAAFPGAGPSGVTFTKTDRVLRNTNGVSDSFSITIGTGTVIIATAMAVAPTSITLNGSAMTKRIATTSGANGSDCQIWSLAGQTAGVATLAISAAFLPAIWEVSAAVLTGANASPGTGVIQNEVVGGSPNPLVLGPLNIPAGGIGIVLWNEGDGAGSDPNGNLTIDYQTAASQAHVCGLAHTTSATGPTVPIGITTLATNVYAGVSLPWGP